MRSARFGGAGQSRTRESPSSQTGPNCHTACPRSHIGFDTKIPSQSMKATARPTLKTVLRGAISPWHTMAPSVISWGPSSKPASGAKPRHAVVV